MPSHRMRARPARGAVRPELVDTRDEAIQRVLEDAAHYPGGHARGVAVPENEAEVAALVRMGLPLLPVGAQSSLTGGATPMGEIVLTTARLNRVLAIEGDRVRVEPGVVLDDLQDALRSHDRWFPPVPTYTGACCGGVVATDAAGPATFKYGPTRRWVRALSAVLACGEVVDVERGQVSAHPHAGFEIETAGAVLRVPVPALRRPPVPKCSAGYFGAPGMDLVDLFIGSEGTLGVVTEIVFDIAERPAATCLALVPVATEAAAIAFVNRVRPAARETWRGRDPRGLDVSAIEHVDARSIALLREDGADRANDVTFPDWAGVALLVEIELARAASAEEVWRQLEDALDPDVADGPLVRFCRMLAEHGLLDATELAFPGDGRRAAQFRALREAVPAAVNHRVALARAADPGISKAAGDIIVPFDRFGDMMEACRAEFGVRGLDLAVWGHVSDGNVHPNVVPRTAADVRAGGDAILALGRRVVDLGGSPLAEHGVGRNPVKKALLRLLHGERGVEAMRRVKQALDPDGRLSPGVIF